MLLGGHLCTRTLWDDLYSRLVADGLDVSLADLNRESSVEAMATQVLAGLTQPKILVGFSMGGIVALQVHALASDLVAGIILISSNARPDMPERSATRLEHQRRARSGELSRIMANELAPYYFAPENDEHGKLRECAMAMAEEVGPDVFIRQSQAIRTRPDARPGLSLILCPCLVVGGLKDALSPTEWSRELATEIPSAELRLFENCGHFVPLEAPDSFAAAVRDWRSRHEL